LTEPAFDAKRRYVNPAHLSALSAQLEGALLRELVATWKHLNWDLFREAMGQPTFVLADATSTLGRWNREVRTIEISRTLALEQPWGVVIEVLKHEMAHQYVHEVLGVLDEQAHGPAFREVCERLAIDASASGLPASPKPTMAESDARILERIAKLLALAESPNVHEAEAAMAAAQRLMLKHNLEHRSARHARGYAFRHVGRPSGRITEGERKLASLLGDHFFVEAIWVPVYRAAEGKRASVLELCGTPANLEIAEYVHSYLMQTAERLWRDHQRAHGFEGNRERRTFVAGVMSGFAQKLAREKVKHKSEGLVWVRDGDLDVFMRRRHPHVHTVRYGGGRRGDAFAHGRAAGERIVLHRGVSGPAVSRGRLLKA
jgi:hypothetical protein